MSGNSTKTMEMKLKIWRQKNCHDQGRFEEYTLPNVSPDMSFLEMLDVLNEKLSQEKKEPVAFDHDCREGICGSCGVVINGLAHGGVKETATCQLHMRLFKDGDTIVIEPWRAKAFPVIKDLVVDRSAFDRVISAGGFVSTRVGNAPDGNAILVPKPVADEAFDAATCIGCGACVASCKNASASLFVAAKISQLALLPQGQAERSTRANRMVAQMEKESFGACTNEGECEAICPKGISVQHILRMNREVVRSKLTDGTP